MKGKIFLIGLCLTIGACSRPHIVEVPVSRNQIYYGQSIADLQDNFGAPKRAARYAYDVIEYKFIHENFYTENFNRRLLYCHLWVYAQNNRVIDWKAEGNDCHIKEPEVHRYLDEHREEIPARLTFDKD
ncbi:MAG: hypothetical protein J6T55_01310 [Alphaproteobacteria bacterium]|nr:hypothetical protein [Alphaproteobacteria bacterium]